MNDASSLLGTTKSTKTVLDYRLQTTTMTTIATYADVCYKQISKATFSHVLHELKSSFSTKIYMFPQDTLKAYVSIIDAHIATEKVLASEPMYSPKFTKGGKDVLTRLHFVKEMWHTILIQQGVAFGHEGLGRPVVEEDASRVIQQQWRSAISDPGRRVCRKRLASEFDSLTDTGTDTGTKEPQYVI